MKHRGFSLIELLVVIVIIATLSAIAVPGYRRAVLKSRFHMLMPVAQGIHKGEEAYYAMNRHYTDNLSSLAIEGKNEYPDGTMVDVYTDADYSFVRASQEGLNNNYVMFQSRSGQFPSHIFCEARDGDEMAAWLCENVLEGARTEEINITPGYIAYVLNRNPEGLEIPETPHEPVHYENDKTGTKDDLLPLEQGDTCTTNINNGCQYVDASGEGTECYASSGTQGCANSFFDDKAICTAGDISETGVPKAGCQYATFTNGAQCVVNENSGTAAKDTACGGDASGGRLDATGDHSAQYYSAECVNASTSSFGCGRSWYKEGSTCTSNKTNGGCGNSVFDASRCIGRGGNGCDKSTFKNGAICEAQASGTCPKTAETTYDTTSYCVGKNDNTSFSYCPSGLPAEAGPDATRKKWRACTAAEKTAAQAAGFSTSGLTCAG